jgi:transcription initiation factor TFIIH subunit 1
LLNFFQTEIMSGNSLEEIKLVIEHVKNKKVEGTLYLMSERIAWMPKGKEVFLISHHYVDIKSRKLT